MRQEKSRFAFSRARRSWLALFTLLIVSTVCAAQSLPPVLEPNPPNPPNAAAQQAKHYVILVSLDGFRYDYAQKYGAKNLLQMAAQGASAPNGMIPSFPSLTFPNHYTLVTGLYPEHNGIVANTFYDPGRKDGYTYKDPKASLDGSWYGGTPLWVLAEQQGMRSASFFGLLQKRKFRGNAPAIISTLTKGIRTTSASSRCWPGCNSRRSIGPTSLLCTIRTWIMPGTSTRRTARKWRRPSRTWMT